MRVAMVSEHASPLAVLGGVDAGGQNVHVAELAQALARRGSEVLVHTRRDDPAPARRVPLAPGIEVDHVEAGPPSELPKDELLQHMDAFAGELAEQWARWRPDVVHTHFWMSGHAALKAAAMLRARGIHAAPVVHTFHALGIVKRRQQGAKDPSPADRLGIERDVLHGADHVIATCTDEVFELVRMDANRARLTVIPCGADLGTFTPDGPVHPPRRPGVKRIACVGRLVERKGVGTAISALAQLPADVELVIAGGPAADALDADPEVQRLSALAAQVGVRDRVRFLGRMDRDGTAAVMRGADVLVSVPWYEPFGIVPIEAMACGTAVVASAVGGIIDTVVDGVTGVHVPPRDPERLADALAPLLEDARTRAAYGEAGTERARRLYDWDRVGAATLDVYRRVAGAPAAAPERLVPVGASATGRASRRRRRSAAEPDRARVLPRAQDHLTALRSALDALEGELEQLEGWGQRLAGVLADGGRLLTVGSGASAAAAQRLTAELVGRRDPPSDHPLSASYLPSDGAGGADGEDDAGPVRAVVQQVRAHGRPGDVLLALSHTGRSASAGAALDAARRGGLIAWALTGPGPTQVGDAAHETLALPGASAATVHELHLIAVHVLCGAVDRELQLREPTPSLIARLR